MSRSRKPVPRRRPRRGDPHGGELCGRLSPPNASEQDFFIAICESLELWRVHVFEFDAYGPMPDGDVRELLDAIDRAADELEDTRPAAAIELRRLLDSLDE